MVIDTVISCPSTGVDQAYRPRWYRLLAIPWYDTCLAKV